MLSERLSELLSAYVDGELSPRRRRAVERLLRKSAEAQALVNRLQEDAGLLRGLPPVKLSEDLSRKVLAKIVERRLHLGRRQRVSKMAPFPSWAGLAAAAAVLLVVGVSTYLYYLASAPDDVRRGQDVAINGGADRNGKPGQGVEPRAAPKVIEPKLVKVPDPDEPKRPEPAPLVKAPRPADPPQKSVVPPGPPKEPDDTELAIRNPTPKMEVFEKVRIALSLSLQDLEQEKSQQRLRESLQKDGGYRLELFSLGKGKAFERLQRALQAQGLRLLIDTEAQRRLKRPQLSTDYVLYTEELTPEELAAALRQLAREDRKADPRKSPNSQFGDLIVDQMTEADHTKLSELLGVDPTKLRPVKPQTPLGVDIHKPLSEGTKRDVVKAVAGQGPPKSESPATAVKGADRVALVLAYNPVRPNPNSPVLKQFFSTRKERRPGTVQLLLFLRGANG